MVQAILIVSIQIMLVQTLLNQIKMITLDFVVSLLVELHIQTRMHPNAYTHWHTFVNTHTHVNIHTYFSYNTFENPKQSRASIQIIHNFAD